MLAVFVGASHAQKKAGTIYVEHEYIDKTKAMWDAFIEGDREKYESYFYDSVWVSSNGGEVETVPNSEMGDNIDWWQTNFTNIKIEDHKPAYPDALDYKDGGMWVQDWRLFTARHKKTGINLEIPIHSLYAFNDDGKIYVNHAYFNNDVFGLIRESQTTTENGKVYDNHPYILTVRKLVNAFEDADADKYHSFFTDDATFIFSWDEFGDTKSLEESKDGMKRMFAGDYWVEVDQVGYPDCVFYERGGNHVVYSWWKHTIKKDGKKYEFPVMLSHTFNDDGKIINEYVNASSNHWE
jgi:ketosteroid isomerase-like protein